MLSKRLDTIAQMIDTSNVYDVGCDHALLDIYLTKEKNINCIAIDKSKDCVKKAINNCSKYNVDIKVLCNDGLNNIDLLQDSTVVISGMGTKNIINIIKNKDIETLICQSNKNIYELRKNICNLGYYIKDEKIIFDDKYYIIMKFKKGKKEYSDKQYFLGPILLNNKDDIYINYLKRLKKIIEKDIDRYDYLKKEKYMYILDEIKKEI